MFTARRFILCVLATVWAVGCKTSPVHIVSPWTGKPDQQIFVTSKDPVPQIAVFFDSNFNTILANPSTQSWSVDLDGTALSGFSPAPASGVTSTVPLVFQQSAYGQHLIKTHATC